MFGAWVPFPVDDALAEAIEAEYFVSRTCAWRAHQDHPHTGSCSRTGATIGMCKLVLELFNSRFQLAHKLLERRNIIRTDWRHFGGIGYVREPDRGADECDEED